MQNGWSVWIGTHAIQRSKNDLIHPSGIPGGPGQSSGDPNPGQSSGGSVTRSVLWSAEDIYVGSKEVFIPFNRNCPSLHSTQSDITTSINQTCSMKVPILNVLELKTKLYGLWSKWAVGVDGSGK